MLMDGKVYRKVLRSVNSELGTLQEVVKVRREALLSNALYHVKFVSVWLSATQVSVQKGTMTSYAITKFAKQNKLGQKGMIFLPFCIRGKSAASRKRKLEADENVLSHFHTGSGFSV